MQVLRPVSSHPAQGDEASLRSFTAAGLEGKCEIRARTGRAGAAGRWCLEDTGSYPAPAPLSSWEMFCFLLVCRLFWLFFPL